MSAQIIREGHAGVAHITGLAQTKTPSTPGRAIDGSDSEPNNQVRSESMTDLSNDYTATEAIDAGWTQFARETFDAGNIAVRLAYRDGAMQAEIGFEGGGPITSSQLREAAKRYERFPAWLRAMAEALDSEYAGEMLAHLVKAKGMK